MKELVAIVSTLLTVGCCGLEQAVRSPIQAPVNMYLSPISNGLSIQYDTDRDGKYDILYKYVMNSLTGKSAHMKLTHIYLDKNKDGLFKGNECVWRNTQYLNKLQKKPQRKTPYLPQNQKDKKYKL